MLEQIIQQKFDIVECNILLFLIDIIRKVISLVFIVLSSEFYATIK